MKKFVFCILVIGLLVFAGRIRAGAAEITINKTGETISWKKSADTTGIMYYTVLSSASTSSVSVSKLSELSSDASYFYFDYSALSCTKNNYIVYVYG